MRLETPVTALYPYVVDYQKVLVLNYFKFKKFYPTVIGHKFCPTT